MGDCPTCVDCGKEDLRLLPEGKCITCKARQIAEADLTIGDQSPLTSIPIMTCDICRKVVEDGWDVAIEMNNSRVRGERESREAACLEVKRLKEERHAARVESRKYALPKKSSKVDELRKLVDFNLLASLKHPPVYKGYTAAELARLTGFPYPVINWHLKKMLALKVVEVQKLGLCNLFSLTKGWRNDE